MLIELLEFLCEIYHVHMWILLLPFIVIFLLLHYPIVHIHILLIKTLYKLDQRLKCSRNFLIWIRILVILDLVPRLIRNVQLPIELIQSHGQLMLLVELLSLLSCLRVFLLILRINLLALLQNSLFDFQDLLGNQLFH